MKVIQTLLPRDCREIRRLMDDFLSGELSIETSRWVLDHFERCEICRQLRRDRETERLQLRESWDAQPVPPHLLERLRRTGWTPRSAWSGWLGIAALFVMFLMAGGLLLVSPWNRGDSGPSDMQRVVNHYQNAMFDHLNCRGQLIATEQTPLARFHQEIERAVQLWNSTYHLTEVRECTAGGVEFTHYVFAGNGKTVSLMLEPRARGSKLSPAATERTIQGIPIFLIHDERVALASLASPQFFVYLLTGGSDTSDALRLTENLIFPLRRALFES